MAHAFICDLVRAPRAVVGGLCRPGIGARIKGA